MKKFLIGFTQLIIFILCSGLAVSVFWISIEAAQDSIFLSMLMFFIFLLFNYFIGYLLHKSKIGELFFCFEELGMYLLIAFFGFIYFYLGVHFLVQKHYFKNEITWKDFIHTQRGKHIK